MSAIVLAASCGSPQPASDKAVHGPPGTGERTQEIHRVGCDISVIDIANRVANVTLRAPSGTVLYADRLLSPKVEESTFDIDADGAPDSLLVGLREGTEEPRTVVFSCVGRRPWIVISDNRYGFSGAKDYGAPDRLVTWQDGFQGRAELLDIYHYDLEVPPMIVRVSGGKLHDDTQRYTTLYRDIARESIAEITRQDRRMLASMAQGELEEFRRGVARGKVLCAIVSLIYARQEKEARDLLDRVYTGPDKEQFWEAIAASMAESTIKLD